MLRIAIIILTFVSTVSVYGQSSFEFAKKIRADYRIPELCYAVISADTVYEMHTLGVRKVQTKLNARINDRFRIGSNTKAITGFIAAQLVNQGKISWDTKFFDLFPEMLPGSRKEYRELTLLQLLSMRTKLFRYTYTDATPVKGQFKGDESKQRYQFTKWFLRHAPVQVTDSDSVSFSNLGYVAASLMLEKVSGKPYKQLVKELGRQIGVNFEFGQPNAKDPTQTWGHNASLVPEAQNNVNGFKLDWLLPAGNINITLPDYVLFTQLQLKGLHGKSYLLTKDEFYFLHYGLPQFAVGWFWARDEKGRQYSYNVGNPGSFLTKVYVYNEMDKAFIIFANAQADAAEKGIDLLYNELKANYCH